MFFLILALNHNNNLTVKVMKAFFIEIQLKWNVKINLVILVIYLSVFEPENRATSKLQE
jgi:hypothetical protein